MTELYTLIGNLESSDKAIREAAAEALHGMGDEARPAAPTLLKVLLSQTGSCPWVGTAASLLICESPDIPVLRKGLHHSNSHVRFWIARAIVKLGPLAEPLIEDLIQTLTDTEHPVADSACWALGSIGESAIPVLSRAAKGEDASLRSRAVVALGRYSDFIEAKLDPVLESQDDADPSVRLAGARAVLSLAQSGYRGHGRYSNGALEKLGVAVKRIDSDPTMDDNTAAWCERVKRWMHEDESGDGADQH